MRFFGLKDKAISVDEIAEWLQKALIDGEIESEEEDFPGDWKIITLFLESGEPVVEIEKFSEQEDTLKDAIQFTVRNLLDDHNPVKPESAVRWLCQFMTRVKVLYEFRPMQGIKQDKGWLLFNEVWTNLRESLQGIVHLDEEGFTNQQGAQITWEYPGDETGDLKVAVLDESGEQWIEYTMDLANQEHKQLFMAGKAPDKS